MGLGSRMTSGLRNLFHKRQVESQLDDEVRSFVDLVTDERIAAGMFASEARRTTLAEFGGIELVKQAVREHGAGTNCELLWQDIRYGMRQLRRNRGFTLTAVVTLGLGIGATTAIFSAVYSLLLHPLPYNDSSRLITVTSAWPKSKSDAIISPDFVAAQNDTKSFEQFAGYAIGDAHLTRVGEPLKVTRASVTDKSF